MIGLKLQSADPWPVFTCSHLLGCASTSGFFFFLNLVRFN